MIRCNLAILLAERNLRITKVSKDTGISRTTLTSLSSNKAQGIQFDTINTLCNYLNINPNQLITHTPIDVKLKEVLIDDLEINNRSTDNSIKPTSLELTIEITKNGRPFNCYTSGSIYVEAYNENLFNEETGDYSKILSIGKLEIFIELYSEEDNPDNADIVEENLVLIDTFNNLPISFINDLKNEIVNKITYEIGSKLNTRYFREDFNIHFYWDERLIK